MFSTVPQSRILPSRTVTLKGGFEPAVGQQGVDEFAAELPVLRGAGFVMLDDRVGEPVQKVGTAHDTCEPAVLQHRDAFDVKALEQPSNFVERRVLIDG